MPAARLLRETRDLSLPVTTARSPDVPLSRKSLTFLSKAGKVTASLAESDDSPLLDLCMTSHRSILSLPGDPHRPLRLLRDHGSIFQFNANVSLYCVGCSAFFVLEIKSLIKTVVWLTCINMS